VILPILARTATEIEDTLFQNRIDNVNTLVGTGTVESLQEANSVLEGCNERLRDEDSSLNTEISLFGRAHSTRQSGLNQTQIDSVARAIKVLSSRDCSREGESAPRDADNIVPLGVGAKVQWHIRRLANDRLKLWKRTKWVADTMSHVGDKLSHLSTGEGEERAEGAKETEGAEGAGGVDRDSEAALEE
jgi:hypothetical protein